MDVDPDGDLHAIWFDNRNDPENLLIETFQGDSTDGGATWANRNISTASWNPNLSFFSSGAFVGDYNGIAAGERRHLPDLDRWPQHARARRTATPTSGRTWRWLRRPHRAGRF